MKKLKPFMDGEGRYFVKARFMFFLWCNVSIYTDGDMDYEIFFAYIKRFDTLVEALGVIQKYYDYKSKIKKQNIHIPIDNIESIEHAECFDER